MIRCAGLAEMGYEEGLAVEGVIRVVAIAYNETCFRPEASGARGELGMMQVLPKRCAEYAKTADGCDPDRAGIRYLKNLRDRERVRAARKGRAFAWRSVVRRYNGSGRVARHYATKVQAYAFIISRKLESRGSM
jgi:hypothetical protein